MKLQRTKFGWLKAYPGVTLEAFAADPESFFQPDDLLVKVRGFVTSELIDEREYRYPADWWQALKERWLPKRLLSRFPVRYETMRFEAHRLYPRVSLPDEEGAIRAKTYKLNDDGDMLPVSGWE